MRTEIRKVHSCDHCPKKLVVEKAMARHEDLCHKNPDNRNKCFGCANLRIEELIRYWDAYDGQHETKTGKPCFRCKEFDVDVHTRIFSKKNGVGVFSDKFGAQIEGKTMPKETEPCERFTPGEPEDVFNNRQ